MVSVVQGGPLPIVVISQEAAALRGPQDPHKEVGSSERAKRNGQYDRRRESEVPTAEKGKKVNLQV